MDNAIPTYPQQLIDKLHEAAKILKELGYFNMPGWLIQAADYIAAGELQPDEQEERQ